MVINIATFASEGTLSGPNPFPAFQPRFLFSTLGLYFIALAAIIFSVKSYIFEFDKGIGITTDKKDKGYSRWTKEKEIINRKEVESINILSETSNYAGTPLLYKNGEIYTTFLKKCRNVLSEEDFKIKYPKVKL